MTRSAHIAHNDPKNVKGRGKKLLLWLAGVIVLLVTLVALSPYWLGLALPAVLAQAHIRYGAYERTSYSTFKLRDVTYAANGTIFHAAEVDGATPLVWFWNKSRHPNKTFLNATHWTLSFEKSNASAPGNGISQSINKAQEKVNTLRQWVSHAELHDGVIEVADQKIPVPLAVWANGNLSSSLTISKLNDSAIIDAQIGTLPWTITASISNRDLRANAVLTNTTSIGGSLFWHTNRADFSAELSATNILPASAVIEAKNFRITANDADLRGYDDIVSTVTARWEHDEYSIDLRANATPSPQSTNLEPFTVTINATGNTNAATLRTFTLSSPGMQAHLSEPMSVNFKGEMLNPAAKFVIDADLSKQPFLPVRGLVSGTAGLQRRPGTYPEVTFDISGKSVIGFDIEAAEIKTHGRLEWPIVDLQSLDVRFVNGTTAKFSTAIDLQKRFVERGKVQFSGKIGEDFIPVGYDYDKLSLRVEFHGPLETLEHSGEFSLADLVVPYFKTFRATVKWAGKGTTLQSFTGQMKFPNAGEIALSGSADVDHSGITNLLHAKIDKLNISSRGQTLALKKPTKLFLALAKTNNHGIWNAEISSVQLRSSRGDLMGEGRIEWPHLGRVSIYGHHLDSEIANEFLIRPLPEVYIQQIAAAATWSNGPAKWNLDTIAQFVPATIARLRTNEIHQAMLTPADVRVQAYGDERGTVITNFSISQNQHAIATATGQLPLTIDPTNALNGTKNLIHLDPEAPIQFHLVTETNAAFWDAVMQGLPISARNPSVQLAVTGTLNEPRGTIRCDIPSGNLKLLKNAAPFSYANLKANATLDRHQIHLLQLDTLIEGQPLWATATLPIPEHIDRDWRKLFDWRTATGQVRADNVQIAPFVDFERQFISPEGTVSANINVNRGKIDGSIIVANAATRAIAQFGAVRDIRARLTFSNGHVNIDQCAGTLSGGPVSVEGWADLTQMPRSTNLPPFVIYVRGESVPVARRSDLIVRANFNIIAANTHAGPGLLTGNVNLEDSYLLSDLKLLVPPHAAKPQNRPPYFSIDTKPFDTWKLDIKVKGDQFVKVRTPFFNGVCSTDMHLGGTLGSPLALGDATINSGTVEFPFANVKITQGFVTLTAADPYMPHLFVTGSTKAYDFDIRMNVTGPVDNPKIEFTSTPALTSEQILVMLTTGELPASTTGLTMQQRTLKVGAFVGKSILSRFGVASGSEQRLTLESSRDATEQNTQTYSAEYKINDDWSIIADYNQFGGLNVGAKWRFYSK